MLKKFIRANMVLLVPFLVFGICVVPFWLWELNQDIFSDKHNTLNPQGSYYNPGYLEAMETKEFEKDNGNKQVRIKHDNQRANFLLLGLDRDDPQSEDYYRPDTIIVLSLDLMDNKVHLVSIPRDTYMKIEGENKYDKINHAFVYGMQSQGGIDGGVNTTAKSIEAFLGDVPLHYYVVMDMYTIRNIVDAMGGIKHEVGITVRNHAGRGDVVVEKGEQILCGDKFMHYVRARSIDSDIYRTKRQQHVLESAYEQIRSQNSFSQLAMIYFELAGEIDTNLKDSQVLGLINFAQTIDGINSNVFTGSGGNYRYNNGGIYYLMTDERERQELLKEVFGKDVSPLNYPQPDRY